MTESIERVERALAAASEEEQREAERQRRYRPSWEDTTQRSRRDQVARNLLPRFIDVVRAAGGHAHEFGHATRCELCDALALLGESHPHQEAR